MGHPRNFMGLDRKGRMAVRVTVPLPPSDNSLTFIQMVSGKGRGKGKQFPKRTLTTEARAFKNAVKQEIAALALKTTEKFQKDVRYECIIRIYLEQLENSTWPDGAKDRYKQVDATNRTKLIIDAVSEAIGIDDKHHFTTLISKHEDREDPHITITVREEVARGEEA